MGAGLPTRLLGQERGNVGEACFKATIQQVVHLVDDFVWGHEFPKCGRRGLELYKLLDHRSGVIDCELPELAWETTPSGPVEGVSGSSPFPQRFQSLRVNTVPKITRTASCNTSNTAKSRVSRRREKRRGGDQLRRTFRSRVIWGRRRPVRKEVVGFGGGWLALKVGRRLGRDEGPSNGDQRKTGGSSSGSEYGGKLGRGMLGGAGEDGGVHCRGAV